MLIHRHGRLLLIERGRPPYGYAPPAGHVDGRKSFEEAARAELAEEVGLVANRLDLVIEGRKNNPCRRENGTWHFWRIYVVDALGDVLPNPSEAKRYLWCTRANLEEFKCRTDRYLKGELADTDWMREPGLEPVWREWLFELNYFDPEKAF